MSCNVTEKPVNAESTGNWCFTAEENLQYVQTPKIKTSATNLVQINFIHRSEERNKKKTSVANLNKREVYQSNISFIKQGNAYTAQKNNYLTFVSPNS